jgi:RHS repeat-associated protein
VDEHSSRREQPYKFNGKELDEEVGLYYYGARYYEPHTSIWYGVDALAEKYPNVGGMVYCVGNPIKYLDIDGMDWVEGDEGNITWTDYTSQKDLDNNNIKGTYLGQAHLAFNGSRNETLGTKNGKAGYINGEGAGTASVTLYGSKNADDVHTMTGFTMTSDAEQYGPIGEGLYNANYDARGKDGKLQSHWVLNNRGKIPTMDNQPNLSPHAAENYNTQFKTGIFIHSTNGDGFAGGNVSVGCLLLAPQDFKTFNSVMSGVKNFTVQVTRQQTINVPLQGVTGVVPNVFIQQTIIKK